MKKEELVKYIENKYNTNPEYLWKKDIYSAVLRHKENNKWYAILMKVRKDRLGIEGEGELDIINVKCDKDMSIVLSMTEGILPGYHMNKEHWITIILDSEIEEETIYSLIDNSYELTKK